MSRAEATDAKNEQPSSSSQSGGQPPAGERGGALPGHITGPPRTDRRRLEYQSDEQRRKQLATLAAARAAKAARKATPVQPSASLAASEQQSVNGRGGGGGGTSGKSARKDLRRVKRLMRSRLPAGGVSDSSDDSDVDIQEKRWKLINAHLKASYAQQDRVAATGQAGRAPVRQPTRAPPAPIRHAAARDEWDEEEVGDGYGTHEFLPEPRRAVASSQRRAPAGYYHPYARPGIARGQPSAAAYQQQQRPTRTAPAEPTGPSFLAI